jgi:hypothetical protein
MVFPVSSISSVILALLLLEKIGEVVNEKQPDRMHHPYNKGVRNEGYIRS